MDSLALTLEFSRARAGGDAFAFQDGPQVYQVRTAGGGVREVRLDWDQALLDDLAAMGGTSLDPGAAARLGERLRSLVVGTAFEAFEERLSGLAQPFCLTIRSAAAELYALPWELLALRSSGLWLGQVEGGLLRLEWPETRTAQRRTGADGRLLLAWSEAGGGVPAAAHSEILRSASADSPFAFDPGADTLPEASLEGLAEALAKARAEDRCFTTLHLVCHGSETREGGALWLDGAGGPVKVDAGALRGVLAPFADSLRLVVLCACNSAHTGSPGNALGGVALALHRVGIEAVVAPRRPLRIPSSVAFSTSLYTGLYRDLLPLERALQAARSATRGSDGAAIQLFARVSDGGDTRPFVFRPFRGLLAFDVGDSRFFFGREAEGQALLARVLAGAAGRAPRFQVLSGATGSGKSSLVRAGLIPALIGLDPPWSVVVLRPGASLVPGLDAALDALTADEQLLVVVDPLQDLFNTLADPEERSAQVRALWEASAVPRVVVLCVIRVDFLGRCEEVVLDRTGIRLDAVAYDDAHRSFLPMAGPAQMRAAIERPLQRVGLACEPGLVEVLLTDAGSQPGALPLLQDTLDRLWAARRGRLLTHAAYQDLGGLSGALARSADEILDQFSADELGVARRLLVALVGEAGSQGIGSRLRVPLSALHPANSARRQVFARVLEALVRGRLVVVDGAGEGAAVEVAHEALIRRWTRLRAWYEEDRDGVARLAEISRWAADWRSHRADADGGAPYLLRGSRLGYAAEICARQPEAKTAWLADFLAESEAADRAEELARQAAVAERERLAQQALDEFVRARDAALLASALAVADADPTTALLLLREVRSQNQPVPWVEEALELLALPVCEEVIACQSEAVDLEGALVPSDPRRLIVVRDGQILLQELGGDARPLPAHPAPVSGVAWAPDGQRFATGCLDGTVRVFSATGAAVAVMPGHSAPVRALRFSPDGRSLASASEDGTIRRWAASGAALGVSRGHLGPVRDLSWSPDGGSLASASDDLTVRVWSLHDGECAVLRGHDDAVLCARYRPDGRALLSTSRDGSVRVWDLRDRARSIVFSLGRPLCVATWRRALPEILVGDSSGWMGLVRADGGALRPLSGHTGAVLSLVEGPDGRLRSLSADGTLRLWRLEPSGQEAIPQVLHSHTRKAIVVGWSPDGRSLASGAADGSLVLRGADGRGGARTCTGHTEALRALAWRADGTLLATGAADDTARVWEAASGRCTGVLLGHDNQVRALAWSANGAALATGSMDGTARVWRTEGARLFLAHHPAEVRAVQFSPAGDLLLTLGADGLARLWVLPPLAPPECGQATVVLGGAGELGKITSLAWRPGAATVALGTEAGGVWIWSVADGGLVERWRHGRAVRALAWTPDGAVLASGAEAGEVLVAENDEPVRCTLAEQSIVQLAFAPTGQRLVVLASSGQGWVMADGGRSTPLALRRSPSPLRALAWDPAGERVAAACDDGALRIWTVSPARLIERLRRASACVLSPEQRLRYGIR